MFCIQSFFLSRSGAFLGGAGAKMFYLEPKKKISGAGAEEKWFGSATHFIKGRSLTVGRSSE